MNETRIQLNFDFDTTVRIRILQLCRRKKNILIFCEILFKKNYKKSIKIQMKKFKSCFSSLNY